MACNWAAGAYGSHGMRTQYLSQTVPRICPLRRARLSLLELAIPLCLEWRRGAMTSATEGTRNGSWDDRIGRI